MALDEQHFIAGPLNQYFVDKDTGLPLAAGTISFFRDTARTTPKAVFQLTGTPPNYTYTALPNPITLSSVGTIENAANDNVIFYYFPYDANDNIDLYHVVCASSGSVEQWTRSALPNLTSGNNPIEEAFPVSNQITNPQFTRLFINDTITTTYTVSGASSQVFVFAPDWNFVISGTGTVVVQQVAIAGNDNVVTSPPYVMDITVSTGITLCNLVQTFPNNSGLWASTSDEDIYIAATMVARNELVGTTGLTMTYTDSTTSVIILNDNFDNSAYVTLNGTSVSPIPLSTNTVSGELGLIEISINFIANTHVRITSIQVVPTLTEAGGDTLSYDNKSSNREQAMLGDYFIPKLEILPIPSLLTGWDFVVNPAQFGSTGTINTTAAYVWDQTIGEASTGNVTFKRNSISGGLEFATTGTNDAFYILQYLTSQEAKEILGTQLSVNINAYKAAAGDDVVVRVYLFGGTSAATVPTIPTTIGTIADTGIFTLTAANWTLIPRNGLDTATVTINTVNPSSDLTNDNNYGFSEFEIILAATLDDTDKFAMVVTFQYPDTGTDIVINSASVCKGNLPTIPAPQTFDEVLRECRYYYETSYAVGTAISTATLVNSLIFEQHMFPITGNVTHAMKAVSFYFEYKETKRAATPTVVLYSTSSPGAVNTVRANIYAAAVLDTQSNVASTSWTLTAGDTFADFALNTDTVVSTTGTITGTSLGFIAFHYSVDARLGIV